jgi:coenzyme F420 biosynthesis associated uncharacterized protein
VSTDVVDWSLARRVARVVAGQGHPIPQAERPAMVAHFADLVAEADGLVRECTKLDPAEPAGKPVVFGRHGWIDANVDGFKALMRPLADRIAERAPAPARALGGKALGVQMGILLGYLSQKVLGQYDLLLASGGKGKVYFVAPNIVGAEHRWGLQPNDFRLWIALHEVTHRTQFVAVPWLRDRVTGLIDRYVRAVEIDPARLRAAFGRLIETLAKGPSAWSRATVMSIFLSPTQQDIVNDMQSLMTVVEGHGNFVMDRVGAERIPSYAAMKDALTAQRGRANAAERAFQRAIGLDMKYQQYSQGERFVAQVADASGIEGVNRLWDKPENLPTPAELADPPSWIARVEAAGERDAG